MQHLDMAPVMFSESSTFEYEVKGIDPFRGVLIELINNVVKVAPAKSPKSREVSELEAVLSPYVIANKVRQNYPFMHTSTGLRRRIDYFSNSTNNIAIDEMRFKSGSEKKLISQADAEANKINDIMSSSAGTDQRVSAYYVVVPAANGEQHLEDALSILAKARCTPIESADKAKEIINAALRV